MQRERSQESDWDFRAVLDVIETLKRGEEGDTSHAQDNVFPSGINYALGITHSLELEPETALEVSGKDAENARHRVEEFGGIPLDLPSASLLSWGISAEAPEPRLDDVYTSDGPIQKPHLLSSRDWHHAWMSEGDGPPRNMNGSQNEAPHVSSGLTKNQRKKRNRRLRLAEAAEAARRQQEENEANDGDDDDSGKSNEQSHKISKHSKTPSKTLAKEQHESNINSQNTAKDVLATPQAKEKPATGLVPLATPQTIQQAKAKVAADTASTPAYSAPTVNYISKSAKANHQNVKNNWPPPPNSYVALTQVKEARSQVPNFDPFITKIADAQQQVHTLPFASTQSQNPAHSKHEILPLVNWSSVERNWSLLSKLLVNFPYDRKYLVAPLQLSINRPQKKGIHVFVDASNILIGFYDHLKIARGIPKEARVKRVELNFHALALLLERRRPISKRVLAGSMPEVPAFEQARQVGYETCLLEKVFKTPFSSEKKKKRRSTGPSKGAGYLSESESAGNGVSANENGFQAPAKWVEQAVDEVLHKKILESIVDVDIPSEAVSPYDSDAIKTSPSRPTMVLATGDAADAEYGSGFRDTVKRALKSGWMVEVMAFSKNISQDYRRMERLPQERGGWGDRFKIIELDPYAEELFGEGLEGTE